ncbi:MAG: hypothetical protein M3R27_06055 [Bacteroidota bacterium]|nr:hypothetical protein [Bacteroidota bacterium]
METKIKSMGKACGEKLFKTFILLCMSILLSTPNLMAQSDEPSVSNITKTLNAAKEAQRQEFLSYVYMVLGFAVVIAIAWFTNARVQKNKKTALEANAATNAHQAHHPPKHAAHRRVPHRVKR